MDQTTMLSALKTDLGLTTTVYDVRLAQLLAEAAALVAREGAALDTEGSAEDAGLAVMYAAFLWAQRRDPKAEMPRALRWALNNRVFGGKMREAAAT